MTNLTLDKNKKYLLACSFGPDSMALFHLLVKGGYHFDCAIVNYHLRDESNSEVAGLLNYASKFNVKVHVYEVKEDITSNIEARCRNARYTFFKELSEKYGYDEVLVAHHQDDLIETYLLQKQRQNYPIYYGIEENTFIMGVKIHRPLLNYKKSELLTICDKNQVPYSIDKTNFDVTIKRNKIRHEIVSKMNEEERREILGVIEQENKNLSSLLSSIKKEKLSCVDYVLSLDLKTASYALNMLAKSLNDSLYLSRQNVGQVLNVLKSSKPNGQFKIKEGLYLLKEYEQFEFLTSKIESVTYAYLISKPDSLNTKYFYLDFTGDTSNRNVSPSDYPIIIRNVKLSDTVFINGYKVKARRLMIDWKVPLRKRLVWPVIINKDNKCIYIPRYQKDFKVPESCNFFVK